jgi:Bacterial mobilisation protein (MobC)
MQNSDQRKAYLQSYQANTHRVAITLTPAEYAELEKRAKAEGVKPTTLVKNMAIAYHQGQAITPEPILKELQELRFLLRNAANNINQIAHHSNTVGRLVDENGFLDEVRKMETTINEFVALRLNPKQTPTA